MTNILIKKDLYNLDCLKNWYKEYDNAIYESYKNLRKELVELSPYWSDTRNNKLYDVAEIVNDDEWDDFNDFCTHHWNEFKDAYDQVDFKQHARTSSFYIRPDNERLAANVGEIVDLYYDKESGKELDKKFIFKVISIYDYSVDDYYSTYDEFIADIDRIYQITRQKNYTKEEFVEDFTNIHKNRDLNKIFESLESIDLAIKEIKEAYNLIKPVTEALELFKKKSVSLWREYISYYKNDDYIFDLTISEQYEIAKIALDNLSKEHFINFVACLDSDKELFAAIKAKSLLFNGISENNCNMVKSNDGIIIRSNLGISALLDDKLDLKLDKSVYPYISDYDITVKFNINRIPSLVSFLISYNNENDKLLPLRQSSTEHYTAEIIVTKNTIQGKITKTYKVSNFIDIKAEGTAEIL
jgi:hypothetical protein